MKHPYPKVVLHWRDPFSDDETTLEAVDKTAAFTRGCVTSGWLVRECDAGAVVATEYDGNDPTILRGVWFIPREAIDHIEGRARCGKGQQKPESGAAKAPDETKGGAR